MKTIYKNIIFGILTALSLGIYAQRPEPAPKQSERIAIVNATIHQGTGNVIEQGTVVFENGRIMEVGKFADTSNAQIIDAKGGHLYPAFISLNNTLGLVETESVDATIDFNMANSFSPEVRTLVAFNTDSHIIPTVRTNGVLYTQPVLRGGILNGTSSLMNLDGWNWEDAVISEDSALHLSWVKSVYPDAKEEGKKKEKRAEILNMLQSYFNRARVYNPSSGKKDYQLEAIQPVLTGKKRLFIDVESPQEALEALDFLQKNKIPYGVLVGDASLKPILNQIKKADIPLVIKRIHSLPVTIETSPNASYSFPKVVADAGILYALDYSGDMEAQGSRNLPFLAGTSVAYGVPYEVAVQSVSANPAKILGIDSQIGTIEKGKRASFFISKGEALNPLTNEVENAFIDGRKIDLNNKQKTLYHRYQRKYGK